MRLPDGRNIGCLQVGRPDGFPIFHFHGNGSSRREVEMLADAAAAAGVRLIGLDRPGIGESDPAPGRTLLDWPEDVAHVADALGIGRFAVQGISAGGAFSLACAYRIAHRLTACALVSSICPPELVLQGGPVWMRTAWAFTRFRADLALACMRFLLPDEPSGEAGAEVRLARIAPFLGKADRDVLQRQDVRNALVRSLAESRRQGGQANRLELLALLQSWNLPIERVPLREVFLWHGEQDRLIPIAPARLLAERLPRCNATFLAGEGHFSTLANHAPQILAALRL